MLIPPNDVPIIQTRISPRLKEVLEYGYDLKLDDYQIYSEEFRPILNQRIVDHFYLREIGASTIEQFIFYLNRTMREVMPVHDPVFQRLAQSDIDLFQNSDTTSEWRQTGKNTSKDSSTATNESKTFNSNAPQINMSGKNMEDYWNTGVFSSGDGATTTDGASTSLADYVGSTHGLAGVSQGQALREWLDLYVNPLMSLYDDLEPCFSQLYSTSYNGL